MEFRNKIKIKKKKKSPKRVTLKLPRIKLKYPSNIPNLTSQKKYFIFYFIFGVKTTFDFEYIFFPIAAIPLHILDIPFVVNVQKYIIAIMYYYFLSLQ